MPEVNTAEESLRQWSAVASDWDRDSDRLFKDVRSVSEWLVDQVDPRPGQKVLELTAGPGETGFLAASRLGSTGRLISSDFVPAMVEAARRRAGDPTAPGGIFSLATPERNKALAASGGFTDITVEELTGTMLFDDPDDYWTHITAVAGPVAEPADSLDGEQVSAIRATLDPSLAPFDRDGTLGLAWLAVVTSAA